MKKLVLALFLVIVSALAVTFSSASLLCGIKTSCGVGETEVLWMTDTTDAHFGEIGSTEPVTGYDARLCCWGVSDLIITSGDLFNISSNQNAHAGSTYPTFVKLSSATPSSIIGCSSAQTVGSSCAFSLSSQYEIAEGLGGAHGDYRCTGGADPPPAGYVNLYCGGNCDPDLDAGCCNEVSGVTPSINANYPELYDPAPPWDNCDTSGEGNCFNIGGSISPTTCCGDDNGEYGINSTGAGANPTDDGCCPLPDQCVGWNSLCTPVNNCGPSSVVGSLDRFYCNPGWQLIDADGDNFDDRCEIITDDGCSIYRTGDNCYGAISGVGCLGCVNGTVTNYTGAGLPGAMVRTIGAPRYNATTDAEGDYWILNITPKTYDFSAEKTGYMNVLRSGMAVSPTQVTTIDFVLGTGPSICQADCSYTSDELCHTGCEGYCDGTSCCTFYDSTAKSLCGNKLAYFRMNYNASHEIQCCNGVPYEPLKLSATANINATNVIRTTRTVWYEGKLVKLVVDVFG